MTYGIKLTLLCSALLACSSCLATEELVIWEDVGRSFGIQRAARNFSARHGVTVTVKERSSVEHLSKVEQSINTGNLNDLPDIFIINSDRIGEAVNKDIIAPVNFMKQDSSLYEQSAIDTLTYNGKIYASPRSMETLVVYYNKDLLEYPYEHIEDYEDLGNKLKLKGLYGLIGKFDLFYFGYGFIAAQDAYIFGKDEHGNYNAHDIGLDSKNAKQGVKTLVDYASKYVPDEVMKADSTAILDELFAKGKTAAVINGSWALETYAQSGVNYGVAPLPRLANGKFMTPFFGIKGYVIPKNSKHKELAEEFIHYINTPINAMFRYGLIAELPPVKEVLNTPLIINDDFANAITTQLKHTQPMPYIAEMGNVWTPMSNAIYSAIKGEISSDVAVDKAVTEIKKTLPISE